jgi:hypothetical protein
VWYTLKDAADRGRLAASTFKQLNLAMAMTAALQLWGLWQMHYLVSRCFRPGFAVAVLLFLFETKGGLQISYLVGTGSLRAETSVAHKSCKC